MARHSGAKQKPLGAADHSRRVAPLTCAPSATRQSESGYVAQISLRSTARAQHFERAGAKIDVVVEEGDQYLVAEIGQRRFPAKVLP